MVGNWTILSPPSAEELVAMGEKRRWIKCNGEKTSNIHVRRAGPRLLFLVDITAMIWAGVAGSRV